MKKVLLFLTILYEAMLHPSSPDTDTKQESEIFQLLMSNALPPFEQDGPDFSQLSQAQLAEILFPNKEFWLLNSQLNSSSNEPLPEDTAVPHPIDPLKKLNRNANPPPKEKTLKDYGIAFRCPVLLCRRPYTTTFALTNHLTSHHHYNCVANDAHYFCARCSRKIYGSTLINRHIKDFHEDELAKDYINLSFISAGYSLQGQEPDEKITK